MSAPSVAPAPAPVETRTALREHWVLRMPAYVLLIVAGILLQIFSRNSQYLGFPIGPDRLCFAAGLLLLVLDPVALREARLRARPLYLGMALLLVWATLSAIEAQTITDRAALFALVDRLGAMPFLFFALATVVFSTVQRRTLLLGALVGLGIYLGATAVLEGIGLRSLVLPGYINDPSLGRHFGRARGPFLESVANGLALGMCGIAAGMGLALWRGRAARLLSLLCLVLCSAGVVFTLTRAVWLGSVVAAVAVFAAVPSLRRWLLPAAVLATVAVTVLLLAVPGLTERASERASNSRSADDRRNANATALRVLAERPLVGIGWDNFASVQGQYLRQADTYPVTNTGIAVHNVPLSHATELGIPAGLVWVGLLGVAVGVPLLRRAPTHEGQVWRAGLLAMAVLFGIVGMLGPLGYAMPNLLIWLFAGIAQPVELARRADPVPA